MREAYVVGFGGAAGSGKTTAANMLAEVAQPMQSEHFEFSDSIMQIGRSLLADISNNQNSRPEDYKDILSDKLSEYGMSVSSDQNIPQLSDAYIKYLCSGELAELTHETKNQHRPLLEWLGKSAIVMVSPTVWGDILRYNVDTSLQAGNRLITIGGVRTIADRALIRELSGVMVRMVRDLPGKVQLDTEDQLSEWSADYTIFNENTKDELFEKISRVWADIVENNKQDIA